MVDKFLPLVLPDIVEEEIAEVVDAFRSGRIRDDSISLHSIHIGS